MVKLATVLSSLAALVLGGQLLCQVPDQPDPRARRRLLGRCVAVDGKPWANAHVTLISEALGVSREERLLDRVEVTSDARGRFRAKLLVGVPYAAWAVTVAESGEYRASEIAEKVLGGGTLLLHEDASTHKLIRIRVSGLEAWKASAPFSVSLYPYNSPFPSLPIELDGNSEAVLPPIPLPYCYVEIIAKDGRRLATAYVRPESGQPEDDAKPEEEAPADPVNVLGTEIDRSKLGLVKAEVNRPYPVLFRIISRANQKPLGGAVVQERYLRDNYTLGTSNEDGYAVLQIPMRRNGGVPAPVHLQYRVWAPGHALAHVYLQNPSFGKDRDVAQLIKDNKPDMIVKLPEGYSVTGRLMLTPDKPAANTPILLRSSIPYLWSNNNSIGNTVDQFPNAYWTDKDGKFEITGRYGGHVFDLRVALSPEQVAQLPAGKGPTCRIVPLFTGNKKDKDLGEVVISQFNAIDLSVTQFDGFPADRAVVAFAPKAQQGLYYNLTLKPQLSTGRRGRLRVFARGGSPLAIAAFAKGGVKGATIDLPKAKPGLPAKQVRIVLEPSLVVAGRVVNRNGKPIPGVTIHIYPYRYSSSRNNWLVQQLLRNAQQGASDRHGRFSFWVGANTQYRLNAYMQGRQRVGAPVQQVITIDDESVTDLEVEINVPDPKTKQSGGKQR